MYRIKRNKGRDPIIIIPISISTIIKMTRDSTILTIKITEIQIIIMEILLLEIQDLFSKNKRPQDLLPPLSPIPLILLQESKKKLKLEPALQQSLAPGVTHYHPIILLIQIQLMLIIQIKVSLTRPLQFRPK